MAELKERLEAVLKGEQKPSEVKDWLTKVLGDGSVSHSDLLADLDAVENTVPGPIVTAFRTDIERHLEENGGAANDTSASDGDDGGFGNIVLDDTPATPEPEPAADDGGMDLSLGLPEDEPAAPAAEDSAEEASDFDLGDLSLEEPDPPAGGAAAPEAPQEDMGNFEGSVAAGHEEEADIKTEFVEPTQMGGSDEDALYEKTVMEGADEEPGDADETVVAGGDGADDDATVVVEDPDATAVSGGPDATVRTGGDDTFDPFSISGGGAGATGGTGWTGGGATDPHADVGPGSILKERFELMDKLGEGGMGAVYRARDLLKVEAKDRNPYVAVKLLSGDFKSHPEAFIALQREASKAQKLAHPNIATVYDFDRDRGTVYMTMEVLKGQELNDYIKKTIPDEGLAVEDAMPLIENLCNGLKYAHERGLVHSDFKPGNAFLGEDGSVKLLDFGIARASQTKATAEGEKTVFDPGQLGALTPAYATIEMFEGMEPDPRDDIYALACTAYELLNKKHPFKKRSAVKAKEMGLTPEPLKKLTRRQNKILMKGLGFTREERPGTVEEFWEELKPRKDYTWHIAGGSVAASLLLIAGAWTPVSNYLQEQEDLAYIAEVRAVPHEVDQITAALEPVLAMEEASQARIFGELEEDIVTIYTNAALSIASAPDGRYEYAEALDILATATRFYPNSRGIFETENNLESERQNSISNQTGVINNLFTAGVSESTAEDLTTALVTLRQIDPEDTLLTDPRVANSYVSLANGARDVLDLEGAATYLDIGLDFLPSEPSLVDLKARVDDQIRQQQNAARIAELEAEIASLMPAAQNADSTEPLVAPTVELMALQPDHPSVQPARDRIRQVLVGELGAAAQVNDFQRAEDLLVRFAQGLDVPWLMEQRTTLSRAELDSGFQPADLAERLADLADRREALDTLIDDPTMELAWESQVRVNFLEVVARMQTGDTWVEELQRDIADAYLAQARDRIERNLYLQARESIDKAVIYYPSYDILPIVETEFETARLAFEAAEAERARVALITSLQNQVRNNARDGRDMRLASEALTTLQSGDVAIDADDPFLVNEVPEIMAAGYLAVAQRSLTSRTPNFNGAVTAANQGLQYRPDNQELIAMRDNARAGNSLLQSATTLTSGGVSSFTRQLDNVTAAYPDHADRIRTEALGLAARRASGMADTTAAVALRDALQSRFDEAVIRGISIDTSGQPLRMASQIQSAFDGAELTRAEQLIAQAAQQQPGNRQLAQLQGQLESRKDQAELAFQNMQQAMQQNNRSAARGHYANMVRIWNDNPDPLWAQYTTVFGSQVTTTVARPETDDGSRLCLSSLAGLGTRGRAACFDMIDGEQGPSMVVVPAGGAFSQPYAISKYEVTVSEFNQYCRATGSCQPQASDGGLPATGVTMAQATGYASWLANQTGKDYRVPTDTEWLYAATSTDPEANKSGWNCRVMQGGSVIKGNALLDAATGQPNPWGLVHVAGNAQELVRAGNTAVARGGAHTDPLSECSVDLRRSPSAGNAPTGFRVARGVDN